jgi:HlyD family secretion protein
MALNIFRKVALERLSSPEQLDQLLHVTGPTSWVVLLAVFAVLLTTGVWGFTGSIPTKTGGHGVMVRTGSVLNAVSAGSGLVTAVYVNVGDHVTANQVVARVSEAAGMEQVRVARAALVEAQQERQRNLRVRSQGAQLQVAAIARERSNVNREITNLQELAKIAQEQIDVDAHLLAKGLITRQSQLSDQQKLVSTNGQIETLHARLKQLDAQEYAARIEPVQSGQAMQEKIAALTRNLASLERELERTSTVQTPYAGEVIELKAVPGALVSAGAPILTIQPEEVALEVLLYLPSERVKAVRSGMEAQISPSIVKREEYGFMRGRVTYVGEFPASADALMRNFQNQVLVQAITSEGTVTEVRVALDRTAGTISGFGWSSSKGPPLTLTSGTLCTGLVVTREQTPVSLLLPFLKRKLGLG